MANFVNFIYEDKKREINIDLIFEITKPWKGTHPLGLMGEGYYTSYKLMNGASELFWFKTLEEAQELYDKLRGKLDKIKVVLQESYYEDLNAPDLIEEIKASIRNSQKRYTKDKYYNQRVDLENYKYIQFQLGLNDFDGIDPIEEKLDKIKAETVKSVRDIMWTFQGMNYSDKQKHWEEYAHKVANLIHNTKLDKIREFVDNFESGNGALPPFHEGWDQYIPVSNVLEEARHFYKGIKAILEENNDEDECDGTNDCICMREEQE